MSHQMTRAVAAAAMFGALTGPAFGSITFGTLSNFDAINDTGQVGHGFEIELEGIHPADVVATFGSPYIRYGDPARIDTGTGTIIRYTSAYDASAGWAAGTPTMDPAHPIQTGGHQLFFQGDPNYLSQPGDHFGVCFNGNAGKTVYRWLIEDSANVGHLKAFGSNVTIPVPTWNVAPAANPANPAAVQAVIPAPEDPEAVFGDAIWVKVFVTESSNLAELNHLVVGDPAMPDETEVEIEWELLQQGKAGFDQLDSGEKDLNPGGKSITRRYEFYKYIGSFDAEGEALDEQTGGISADHPNGEFVGAFIGGQNAALNLEAFNVPEPGGISILGTATLLIVRRTRRRELTER